MSRWSTSIMSTVRALALCQPSRAPRCCHGKVARLHLSCRHDPGERSIQGNLTDRWTITGLSDADFEVRFSWRPAPQQTVRSRDEFRTPLGVRKSPKDEPAGRWRSVWGFRVWAMSERSGSAGRSCAQIPRRRESDRAACHGLYVVDARRGHLDQLSQPWAQAVSLTAAGLRSAGGACRAGSRRCSPG